MFRFLYLILIFTIILNWIACSKDEFSTDPGEQPYFSEDTLSFDTVFSTIGSATLILKVYNPHKKFLNISNLSLAGGINSHFKVNVDGVPGDQFFNIKLRPEDSIYIFCEVNINPNDPTAISPFIVQDSIICKVNQREQKIYLEARGQNANYYPSKTNKGQVTVIDLQGSTLLWNDPRPYILYGIVYIDNGTLEISQGTRLHFFGGITKAKDAMGSTFFYNDGRLIIGSNAKLIMKGSPSNPIICQGVRLESNYQEVPGQWSGIFIDKYSKGNEINSVKIRNNLIGLFLDSLSECKVENCVFSYNSYNGVSAYSANLELNNCLFYDQGQASLAIQCGGNYKVQYCTMVNLGNDEVSTFVSNRFCANPPECSQITKLSLNATFTNCIFTGSNSDEFYIGKDPDLTYPFQLRLDHCLLRISDLIKPNAYPTFIADYTTSCYFKNSLDSLFEDLGKNDYHPDSLSFLDRKAIPIIGFINDLDGKLRDLQFPDLGCYESKY